MISGTYDYLMNRKMARSKKVVISCIHLKKNPDFFFWIFCIFFPFLPHKISRKKSKKIIQNKIGIFLDGGSYKKKSVFHTHQPCKGIFKICSYRGQAIFSQLFARASTSECYSTFTSKLFDLIYQI